jgi:hypothetical protein
MELQKTLSAQDIHELILSLGYKVKRQGKHWCTYEDHSQPFQVVTVLNHPSRQDLSVRFYPTDRDRRFIDLDRRFINGLFNPRIIVLRFWP